MIRLPKYVTREGDRYILRHPSGAVVNLGSSLKEARAQYKDLAPRLNLTNEHTVAAYRRQTEGLWGRVEVREKAHCWPWIGPVNKDGYGYFRGQWSHRLAWSEHNQQPIPAGMVVRHSCDNPGCCNPWHLLVGTNLDNVQDRNERGRTARGARNGRARLTEEQVLAIYCDPSPYSEIATRASVSISAVSDIKTGRNWGWLTGEGNSHEAP